MQLSAMLNDYNWQEAFNYGPNPEDVAEIIATDEGYNDGDRWLAVGRMKDGRYFFLSAGCDYTGWDCQAWGDCEYAHSLPDLIRWRLGDADRSRLGYTLPPETDGAPLSVIE